MILHTVFFLVFIYCRQIFITADIKQLLQRFIYSSLGFSISAVPVWIQDSEWWHWAQAGNTVNIKKTLIVFIFNKMYIKTGSCQYLVSLLTILLLQVHRPVAVPPMSQIMADNKWGTKMDLWCVKFSPKNIRNISNLAAALNVNFILSYINALYDNHYKNDMTVVKLLERDKCVFIILYTVG